MEGACEVKNFLCGFPMCPRLTFLLLFLQGSLALSCCVCWGVPKSLVSFLRGLALFAVVSLVPDLFDVASKK